MQLLIERMIDILKLQVKENLQIINNNQDRINEILKHSDSEEQKKVFNECNAQNKKLLIENNDFINLQLALFNFLEKHKNADILSTAIPDKQNELPDDENIIFDMTVDGELEFDNLHPMFGNDQFFKKLIEYYTSIEAYEKCSELYKVRDLYLSAR